MRVLLLLVSVCVWALASSAGVPSMARNEVDVEYDASKLKMDNKLIKKEKDFLTSVVERLADANIITPEDLRVYYARQSRSDNPLGELAFDVFKELVSTFLTQTVGAYFGFAPIERQSSSIFGAFGDSHGEDVGAGFNLFGLVMEAVRKNTIQRRMGCPT